MFLILGSGYISQAFQSELKKRDEAYWCVSRQETDYTDFYKLQKLIRNFQPEYLINAAGYVGGTNVDGCERNKVETLLANLALPIVVSNACLLTSTPWLHVSSGCIFSGAKVDGFIEPDLRQIPKLLQSRSPLIKGFTEDDIPNFRFGSVYDNVFSEKCSFYAGVKEAAERALKNDHMVLIARLRMPFDEFAHPRSYLTKLVCYPRVYDNFNSLSHLGDACSSALNLLCGGERGIYHLTSPGYMSAREITSLIHEKTGQEFRFWNSDEEFYREAAVAPRSNCILDSGKATAAGAGLREIGEAMHSVVQSLF